MESEGPPAGAAAPAVQAVLGNDDLLRVVFPTTLVRAALVCRHWLRRASAPAFLRRFRGLHPPRLLGVYLDTGSFEHLRFLPLPLPPELAAVAHRASFDLNASPLKKKKDLNASHCSCLDCWNHLLLVTDVVHTSSRPRYITTVRCPLDPARYMAILPPDPYTSIHDGFNYYDHGILLNSNGDGFSYFSWAIGSKEQQTVADVYVLQDGAWAIYTSVVSAIPKIQLQSPLVGDAKIYSVAIVNNVYKLFLLDLVSSCLSLFEFPEEVGHVWSFGLSLANDSGVHLTHLKGFQLRIWLHKMDNNGVGNWILVEAICLRKICANHIVPPCNFENEHDSVLEIHAVGVNYEFIFFEMADVLYMIDMKWKAVQKVYEIPGNKYLCGVYPLMMVGLLNFL